MLQLVHEDLGVVSYSDAMSMQERLHQDVAQGLIPGAIMTLQHPPTLTLGKHASEQNFLQAPSKIRSKGVEIIESERGGEVTAHMPGQLVIYPILPLQDFKLGPKDYVNNILLGSVIKTLSAYGIMSHLDCDRPGVWVETNKICAVGVRIKRRISTHGIALNINNDLSVFDYIIPCGIQDRGVTNLVKETSNDISFDEVKKTILLNIYKSLGILESDA